MGVTAYEHEICSPVPPGKMFKAVALDADNVIPKVQPHVVKCVEVVQGDGGPGTIKKIHFAAGHKFKSMTHRIDAIDKEHHSLCYTVIGGDVLPDFVESISHEMTVSPNPEGGSIYKNKIKYHTKGNEDCTEHATGGKEEGVAMFKAVEAHVLAHPDAY